VNTDIGHITDITPVIFKEIVIVIKTTVFLLDGIRTESVNGREDFMRDPPTKNLGFWFTR
jgi:hypothetical protein